MRIDLTKEEWEMLEKSLKLSWMQISDFIGEAQKRKDINNLLEKLGTQWKDDEHKID